MQRFSEYAKEWLYGESGYYTNLGQIGKSGDFYTSVSASRMFGGCIANQIVQRIESGALPANSTICEIGAHGGFLTQDIASFIYSLAPHLMQTLTFAIVEPLDTIRKEQQNSLSEMFEGVAKIEFFAKIEQLKKQTGFVVSNELFDAFPFELLHKGRMAYVKDHAIVWEEPTEEISILAQKLDVGTGEVAIGFEKFAADISDAFEICELIAFDYGQEFARNDFSARVYKSHQTTPLFEADLAEHFGKSDLTCDVHFGHLTDAFEAASFQRLSYSTQMRALVEFGLPKLLEMLHETAPIEIYKQEAAKARTLIDPAFLGERFKMIRFGKGVA